MATEPMLITNQERQLIKWSQRVTHNRCKLTEDKKFSELQKILPPDSYIPIRFRKQPIPKEEEMLRRVPIKCQQYLWDRGYREEWTHLNPELKKEIINTMPIYIKDLSTKAGIYRSFFKTEMDDKKAIHETATKTQLPSDVIFTVFSFLDFLKHKEAYTILMFGKALPYAEIVWEHECPETDPEVKPDIPPGILEYLQTHVQKYAPPSVFVEKIENAIHSNNLIQAEQLIREHSNCFFPLIMIQSIFIDYMRKSYIDDGKEPFEICLHNSKYMGNDFKRIKHRPINVVECTEKLKKIKQLTQELFPNYRPQEDLERVYALASEQERKLDPSKEFKAFFKLYAQILRWTQYRYPQLVEYIPPINTECRPFKPT